MHTHQESAFWGWEEGMTMTDTFAVSCGLATSPNSQVTSKRCMPLEQLGCQGQP